MGIERAATLYLKNSTTVDTGTGIDIRLLSSTNGGTNDVTQTVVATNAQDNVERTFDPATVGDTTVADATTLQKKGWALRLTEDMTPGDDTNCNAFLPSQTLTVNVDIGLAWTGTILANPDLLVRAALFQYDPATDAGTLIASGSQASGAWNAVTGNGTFKTVAVSITRGSTFAFGQGKILLLQIGLNTQTLPNPLTGTVTYTATLRIDNAVTDIVWAANGHIHQFCTLTGDMVGEGLPTLVRAAALSRDVIGEGVPTLTRTAVAAKSFDMVGEGVPSLVRAAALSRDMVGEGIASMTRSVVAAKSFDMIGEGLVTREPLPIQIARSMIGEGISSLSKQAVAAKSFDVVGEGVLTETHPVQAFRSFDMIGEGEILMSGPNGSTITLPLDELPDGSVSTVIRPTLIFEA